MLAITNETVLRSQTITVDRQMRRFNVPRILFINNMDRCAGLIFVFRPGANQWRVVNQVRIRLRDRAAVVQVPLVASMSSRASLILCAGRLSITKAREGELAITLEI
jgi:elongation factor G